VNVNEGHEEEGREKERSKDAPESSFLQELPYVTSLGPEANSFYGRENGNHEEDGTDP